jgi:DNA processing protein
VSGLPANSPSVATIVSGLAYDVDAIAHAAALQAGGRTLAVLGSGADWIYPARNLPLAKRIQAAGAIFSEYPLGARPDAVHFPRRNRIVSGLSLGTVVVEAYEKGGALITAGLAIEQNREVFAIPSALTNPAGAGANQLIQRGHAKLVQSVGDVLIEIEPAFESKSAPAQVQPDLSPVERRLYEALTPEPTHIDTLCVRTGFDASTALVYLLGLEFKGLVFQMAGKQFYVAR